HNALQALFAGRPIKQCTDRTPPPFLLPTPLPPQSIAAVPPVRGTHGLPGRTLHTAALTLADFGRQLLLAILEHPVEALFGSSPLRVGGLRAGWGGLIHGALVLRGYSYVPGVTVSGKVSSSRGGSLRIGGSAAARGTLRVGARGALTGVLGGRHVRLASPASAGPGLGSTLAAQSRLSSLLASPKRLASLRGKGTGALLRYVFGAPS
ncbi:MAG TPA: hypothetical protein VFV03_05075, partial [Solirubrobacteraceae bacterium]|nr:hypothetical protein [Solirubrobacteraceae bacterium]